MLQVDDYIPYYDDSQLQTQHYVPQGFGYSPYQSLDLHHAQNVATTQLGGAPGSHDLALPSAYPGQVQTGSSWGQHGPGSAQAHRQPIDAFPQDATTATPGPAGKPDVSGFDLLLSASNNVTTPILSLSTAHFGTAINSADAMLNQFFLIHASVGPTPALWQMHGQELGANEHPVSPAGIPSGAPPSAFGPYFPHRHSFPSLDAKGQYLLSTQTASGLPYENNVHTDMLGRGMSMSAVGGVDFTLDGRPTGNDSNIANAGVRRNWRSRGSVGSKSESNSRDEDDTQLMDALIADKWNRFLSEHPNSAEPEEELVCLHCGVRFEEVELYLHHLLAQKIVHDNFCPDEHCPFSAIGFRFRWILRRHICKHHLKEYNSHKVKPDDMRQLQPFLQQVYVCSVERCQRAFYRLDSLLRHERLIHNSGSRRAKRKDRNDY